MPPTLSPQEFVACWRNVTSTEKASAQSHFIDLCHLLGQPAPFEADPRQESYAFERGATKTAGPTGNELAGDPRVEAIAQAARELVEKRERWLNPEGASEAELKKRTLTNLYNQRPAWLDLAHQKLDRAVLDAYGWEQDLGDEEILARLLALNLERAGKS